MSPHDGQGKIAGNRGNHGKLPREGGIAGIHRKSCGATSGDLFSAFLSFIHWEMKLEIPKNKK